MSGSNNNTLNFEMLAPTSNLPPPDYLRNYPLKNITHPHPHDVLCGRGGGTNAHVGNAHWRMLVNANKELYVTLPKKQKMLLSRSIVNAVRSQMPPGRFLQKNPQTQLWFDVGDQKAQEKTSQALREGAPQLRTKLATDDKPLKSDLSKELDELTSASSDNTPDESKAKRPLVPIAPAMPVRSSNNMDDSNDSSRNSSAVPVPQVPTVTLDERGEPVMTMMDSSSQQKQKNNGDDLTPIPYHHHHRQQQQQQHHHHEDSKSTSDDEHHQEEDQDELDLTPLPFYSPRQHHYNQNQPPPSHPAYYYDQQVQQPQQQQYKVPPKTYEDFNQVPHSSMPYYSSYPAPYAKSQPYASQPHQPVYDTSRSRQEQVYKHPHSHSFRQPQIHGHYYNNGETEQPPPPSHRQQPSHRPPSPTAGLEDQQALSFGSISLSDAEQAHLMSTGQAMLAKRRMWENMTSNAPPQPVDCGLEPAGLSIGSSVVMMSVAGETNNNDYAPMNQLEPAGLSFGSAMSMSVTTRRSEAVRPVDGGLVDTVGTSFGSLSLGTEDREQLAEAIAMGTGEQGLMPPPVPVPSYSENATMPTLLEQQRSRGNLLECSDSESEGDTTTPSAEASAAQRSIEWERLQAAVAVAQQEHHQQNDGNSTKVRAKRTYHSAAAQLPEAAKLRNHQIPSQKHHAFPVIDVPATSFQRDMSAISVGDGDFEDDNPIMPIPARQDFSTRVPTKDSIEMPPPAALKKHGSDDDDDDGW